MTDQQHREPYGHVITPTGEIIEVEYLGHLKIVGDYITAQKAGYVLTINTRTLDMTAQPHTKKDMCAMFGPEDVEPMALLRLKSLISRSKETEFYLETCLRDPLFGRRKFKPYTKSEAIATIEKVRRDRIAYFNQFNWSMDYYYRGGEDIHLGEIPSSWGEQDFSRITPERRAQLYVDWLEDEQNNVEPRIFIRQVNKEEK